jgi:hypothetical protein
MGTIDEDGKISIGPLVKIDTSAGRPSELCWLAVSPDDRLVFTTNSVTATSAAAGLTAPSSVSRRIQHARRLLAMAPSERSMEP